MPRTWRTCCAFDSANLAGFVNVAAHTLTVVADMSWVPGGDATHYAVVVPDDIDHIFRCVLSDNLYDTDTRLLPAAAKPTCASWRLLR